MFELAVSERLPLRLLCARFFLEALGSLFFLDLFSLERDERLACEKKLATERDEPLSLLQLLLWLLLLRVLVDDEELRDSD